MKTFAVILLVGLSGTVVKADPTVIVGSKKFTESYVLGEIAKRAIENTGMEIDFRPGMGGTIIVWEALRTGRITLYPDYTGTIVEEILKRPELQSDDAIREALAPFGVGMTRELGFNNTWALVMRRASAQAANVRAISDLRAHPELRFGLTHEFLDRRDGWPPLVQRYQLGGQNVRGIDHALGYEALSKSEIDVKDAYSTDAKIAQNDLVTLVDDLHFFPQYKAVFLYRLDAPSKAIEALRHIEGTLDEQRMRRLNSEAEQMKDYRRAAAL